MNSIDPKLLLDLLLILLLLVLVLSLSFLSLSLVGWAAGRWVGGLQGPLREVASTCRKCVYKMELESSPQGIYSFCPGVMCGGGVLFENVKD